MRLIFDLWNYLINNKHGKELLIFFPCKHGKELLMSYLTFEGELLDTLCVLINWYNDSLLVDTYRPIIEDILHFVDADGYEQAALSMFSHIVKCGIDIYNGDEPDNEECTYISSNFNLKIYKHDITRYTIKVAPKNKYKLLSTEMMAHDHPLVDMFNILSTNDVSIIQYAISLAITFANKELEENK